MWLTTFVPIALFLLFIFMIYKVILAPTQGEKLEEEVEEKDPIEDPENDPDPEKEEEGEEKGEEEGEIVDTEESSPQEEVVDLDESSPEENPDIDAGWEMNTDEILKENLRSLLKKHAITEVAGIGPHTAKVLCQDLSGPCTMAFFVDHGLDKLDEIPTIGKEKSKMILKKISEISRIPVKDLLTLC